MKPRRKRKRRRPEIAPGVTLETIDPQYELTFDDAQFVKAYLTNGGNQLEAAQVAWPHLTVGSAAVAGSRAFRRLRDVVMIQMDQRGLTLDHLIGTIKEGLVATIPVVVKRKNFHENGKIKDEYEEVVYADDFKTRSKFTEMALKLRGELTKQPEVVVIQPPPPPNNGTNSLSVTITPKTLEDFEGYVMGQIQQQLLNKVNPTQSAGKN